MSKAKIVYLLGFVPNPRFNKRIDAAKGEFDVALICWAKSDSSTFRNVHEGIGSRVIHIPANAFDPVARMRPYVTFAKRAISVLRSEKPDIIHLQGLDMLILACWYKRRFDKNVRIVYEVADLHRLLVDEQVGVKRRAFAECVAFFERQCAPLVDKLIVTSERYYDVCYSRFYAKDQILFIPNAPSRKAFEGYVPKEHGRDFTVGFIGGIRYPDEIRMLIAAAKQAGVKVFLAGVEVGDEIRKLSEREDHVEYFGMYDYDTQITELYGRCDVIYSVYPASMKNVRVALPNKLYESMMCGLPLLVAKETYVGDLVEEWEVGIAVQYDSVEELSEALDLLKSNCTMYEGFHSNCLRKACEFNEDTFAMKYIGILARLSDSIQSEPSTEIVRVQQY